MDREYRDVNPERFKSSEKKRRLKHNLKLSQRNKEYRHKNKEKLTIYYQDNAARRAASTKAWRKANSDRWNATVAKRNAAKNQRIPMWANANAIKEFYESAHALSMLLGEWYEVDHIVPLQSKMVCGLHCEQNLQILPKKINQIKGNRYWPDMTCSN